MLVRINDALLVDHSLIKLVKKGTHKGGSEAMIDVYYTKPDDPDSIECATIYGDGEVERVYRNINRTVSQE